MKLSLFIFLFSINTWAQTVDLGTTFGGGTSGSGGGVTSVIGTPPIISSGGSNPAISCQTASGVQAGCLAAIDFTAFNNKQAAGNYITDLSGDVVANGPGAVTATIQANVVSNAKLAQMPANTFKGNNTGSTANAIDLTLSQARTLLGDITSLYGDVTATGTGTSSAAVVNSVGGSSAANIHSAELLANAATSSNTVSTIVKRDSLGMFAISDVLFATQGSAPSTTLSGFKLYADASNVLSWITGSGNIITKIDTSANTANRTYTLPDMSTRLVGKTSGGTVDGQIAVWAGANEIDSDANLFYDATLGAFGIGTNTPTNPLEIVTDISDDDGDILVTAYSGATNNNTAFKVQKARGTKNSPAAIQSGDTILVVGGQGYGTSSFSAPKATGAILMNSEALFTDTSQPTNISLWTTPSASVTRAERMRVAANGNILIGTTSDSGQTLQVVGTSKLGTISSGVWNGTAITVANGGTGQTTANTALNALLPSQTGNSGTFLGTNGSNASWNAAVTSVALAVPSRQSVAGSPITGAGTITVTDNTQAATLVFAGPASGSAAAPTFRALTIADQIADQIFFFGDGSDGNVTINSGTTALTRDIYYNNLTISGTGILNPTNWRVFVRGTLDLSACAAGCIAQNGNNGGSGTNNTAGTGGATTVTHTLGSAPAGGNGGAGSTTTGSNGTAGGAVTAGISGQGATAGTSTAGASAAGTSAAGGAVTNKLGTSFRRFAVDFIYGVTIIQGGSGGGGSGGGGGDGTHLSGGGGGGGAGGNFIYISAMIINRSGSTAGLIQAMGGTGGNAGNVNALCTNCGGSGGGAGGGGGGVYIAYGSLTGSQVTNAIDVSGGAGGNASNGIGANGGNGGNSGTGGQVILINVNSGSSTLNTGAAGTTGSAASGTTGGAGAVINTTQVSL